MYTWIFSDMKIRIKPNIHINKFAFVMLVLAIVIFSNKAVSSGFVAPMPPPELGSKLTDYRTPMQRANAKANNTINYNNRAYTQKRNPRANKEVRRAYHDDSNSMLNDVVHTYEYNARKMPKITLSRNGEAVLNFTFKGYWHNAKIKKVVTGSGFRHEKIDNTIRIWPLGSNANSKLCVNLTKTEKPLCFILRYSDTTYDIRTTENITVDKMF